MSLPPDLATPLDTVFDVLHTKARPLDFGMVLRFHNDLPLVGLEERFVAGWEQAREQCPRIGRVLRRGRWEESSDRDAPLQVLRGGSLTKDGVYRDFMAAPLPLSGRPLRQLLYYDLDRGGWELLTRLHHAAGDAVGLFLVLDQQLRHVFGLGPRPVGPLELRTHPDSAKKSKFAFPGACAAIPTQGRKGGPRSWVLLELEASKARALASAGGFTYNDILIDACFQATRAWLRHRGHAPERLGLFLSCNIREQPFAGFGNGASRIRVYDRFEGDPFRSRCRSIREQVRWGKSCGEWFVPVPPLVQRLPTSLVRFLTWAFLKMPGHDRGSLMFSHMERLGDPPWESLYPQLASIYPIAPLNPHFPLVVGATTFRERTQVSFTYDTDLLSQGEVRWLADAFRSSFELGLAESAPLVKMTK